MTRTVSSTVHSVADDRRIAVRFTDAIHDCGRRHVDQPAQVARPPVSAFSIDVEDYFQVSAFAGQVRPEQWGSYESRVVANTRRLLDLLEATGIRATFYILGWVARHYPQLVRDIQRAGHEIGCHSYWHRLIYEMTPEEFRADLRLGLDVLEEITGEPVRLYRAPSFSVVRSSLWALDILAEEGIGVDSSIFPIRHDRYGLPDAPARPHVRTTSGGDLWEFPPSVFRFGRLNVPVAGGGYFRLFPYAITQQCLHRVTRLGEPAMFYIHPWEVDPDQPRLAGSRLSRFRHYVNLRHTERKLRSLVGRFRFGTVSESLDAFRSRQPERPRDGAAAAIALNASASPAAIGALDA